MFTVVTIGFVALAVVAVMNLISANSERQLAPINVSTDQHPARRQH